MNVAYQTPYRVKLPDCKFPDLNGGAGGDALHTMQGRKTVIILSDGSEHELPSAAREVRSQWRLAGDFYCFIGGPRQVSGIGETQDAAFLSALAKSHRAYASVDTLPKGQDAKQGLAGTEGSAVGEAETPNT